MLPSAFLQSFLLNKLCTVIVVENGLIANISQAKTWGMSLYLLPDECIELPVVKDGKVVTNEYLATSELLELSVTTPQ